VLLVTTRNTAAIAYNDMLRAKTVTVLRLSTEAAPPRTRGTSAAPGAPGYAPLRGLAFAYR